MTVEEWANEGIDIAQKNGKTLEELIGFLKMAYGFKILISGLNTQTKDGEA